MTPAKTNIEKNDKDSERQILRRMTKTQKDEEMERDEER